MDATLGEIVYSKAGRDSERQFVVVEILDDKYVLISDGSYRRFEKAKRKKVRHLELTGIVMEPIKEKIENRIRVSNAEIRKALASYQSKLQ